MGKLVAEFVGTFALVFIGVGSIISDNLTGGALGVTGIALAHGLAIAVMASATGAISGGHLNPAVTCGVLVAGKMKAGDALGYIVAQCAGAVAAAAMIKMIAPGTTLAATGMGTPALAAGVTVGQALIVEIVLTFFLMFVVYGTAIDARAPKMAGLFIGLTVTMDILAGGAITGAAMNPARHLGPALLGGGLSHVWLYWVGPITGAVLASLIYKSTIEAKA